VSVVALVGAYISIFETVMRNESIRKNFIKYTRERNIVLKCLRITIKRRISKCKGIANSKKTKIKLQM